MKKSNTLINGLILAGGQSKRMGVDKGLLEYYNKPQREYLSDLLNKFCKKTFLSCKPNENIPQFLNPLPDKFDIQTPLNGILTALTLEPHSAWLCVPVDMPLINEKHIQQLLKDRNEKKIATCFLDSDGTKPEPLFAIWEPLAYESLKQYCNEGNRSVRDFLIRYSAHTIYSTDSQMHTNVNSMEDFKNLKEKISKSKHPSS